MIAVTGGTGFIGNYLQDQLTGKEPCLILSRKNTDYSKEQLIEQLAKCNCVVHLAGVRLKEPKFDDYLPNIQITENLLYACQKTGIKNIVLASSIAVYGQNDTTPWTEKTPLNPVNFYGLSKLMMEEIGTYYNQKYEMAIKMLRIPQVMGIGERKGYMLDIFIQRAREKLPHELYGSGNGKREYIYVKDLVSAIETTLNHPEKKGVFNIGANLCISHRILAKTINSVFDNQDNLIDHPEMQSDETLYSMNTDKFMREFDWKPKYTLKRALMDMKKINNGERM